MTSQTRLCWGWKWSRFLDASEAGCQLNGRGIRKKRRAASLHRTIFGFSLGVQAVLGS